MKTYACFVTDMYGAVYRPGYFLSSSPAEADERVKREWGPTAKAEEVDEIVSSIEDLINLENCLTHERMKRVSALQ